jgi:hypothetical protein
LFSKILKIKSYRDIMLPAVLCECETWFPVLREKNRLRVTDNIMLREAFGLKREEVTGVLKR